jgi:hypothetical protein
METQRKQWTLTLLASNGEEMDSTTIKGLDRTEAIKNAKRMLLFQGMSSYKFKIKMKKVVMPSFSEWTLEDLVAYCQRWDNCNGDWEDVKESEREYLVKTATETFNEINF